MLSRGNQTTAPRDLEGAEFFAVFVDLKFHVRGAKFEAWSKELDGVGHGCLLRKDLVGISLRLRGCPLVGTAEELLAGDLGVLPLAMLGRLPEGQSLEQGLASVAQRIVEQ